MAMSKKDFIAMADAIRQHNRFEHGLDVFNEKHISVLADFCQSQNPRFMRERWLGYIDGENVKNGGTIKTARRRSPTGHLYREVQQ